MRHMSEGEARRRQFQTATSVGLLADEVLRAAIRYPDLDAPQRSALERLDALLESALVPRRHAISVSPRRSMSDAVDLVRELSSLGRSSAPPPEEFAEQVTQIRAAIQAVLSGVAESEQIELVRTIGDALSRVTLRSASDLSRQPRTDPWTSQHSSSFAAP